nr:translation initiation factor IF-2-like [Anser cygnoides]
MSGPFPGDPVRPKPAAWPSVKTNPYVKPVSKLTRKGQKPHPPPHLPSARCHHCARAYPPLPTPIASRLRTPPQSRPRLLLSSPSPLNPRCYRFESRRRSPPAATARPRRGGERRAARSRARPIPDPSSGSCASRGREEAGRRKAKRESRSAAAWPGPPAAARPGAAPASVRRACGEPGACGEPRGPSRRGEAGRGKARLRARQGGRAAAGGARPGAGCRPRPLWGAPHGASWPLGAGKEEEEEEEEEEEGVPQSQPAASRCRPPLQRRSAGRDPRPGLGAPRRGAPLSPSRCFFFLFSCRY